MPCDTIQTSSILFNAENLPFLCQALWNLGSSKQVFKYGSLVTAFINGIQISFKDSRIIFPRGSETLIDQIKQAHSKLIVISAAGCHGFQIKQAGKNRFLALRRNEGGPTIADDILEIEILEDGTIKTVSGKIGITNHKAADEFLKFIAQYSGGKVETVRRRSTV